MDRVRAERRRTIQRKLNRVADLLGEIAFYVQIDHPEGGVFIEGEGSVNAVAQLDDCKGREESVIASARVDKAVVTVGGW